MEHPNLLQSHGDLIYIGARIMQCHSAFFSIKLERSFPDQKAELSPSAAHSRQRAMPLYLMPTICCMHKYSMTLILDKETSAVPRLVELRTIQRC